MLALVAAAALAQADAPRLVSLEPGVLREEIDLLEAARPSLYPPISTLVLGAIIGSVALAIAGADARSAGMLATCALAISAGGGLSLGATLWGRSRVGEMIEQRERALHAPPR